MSQQSSDLDVGQLRVAFDGFIWPVETPLVTIEAEKGPVQGAGIIWSTVAGKTVLTVEFQLRNCDPLRIHLTEQDDGSYEVAMPPLSILPGEA